MGETTSNQELRVIELFAGVGGFRLALEGHPSASLRKRWPNHGYAVLWANQWEPPGTESRQFAYRCYARRFPAPNGVGLPPENQDLNIVNAGIARGEYNLPDYDLLVGGFPCQDYSVAKPLPQATGIAGKKGVLWWQIFQRISDDKPHYVLLENVDRLLKSPADRRGRDFAVILACLAHLGYLVEWRVVNAADYGLPQRRRRVFVFAERVDAGNEVHPEERLLKSGVLASALPIAERRQVELDPGSFRPDHFVLHHDPEAVDHPHFPYLVSEDYGSSGLTRGFLAAGVMYRGEGIHARVTADCGTAKAASLGTIVRRTKRIVPSYYIDPDSRDRWEYLKGAKKEHRTHRSSGFEYFYSEGAMVFPDSLERASRTILTGEGGSSPSRFKHVIEDSTGRLRRLTPDELERLNGFPRGWTDVGMSPVQRAFCMGNALVVGVVQRIGIALSDHAAAKK